MDKLELRCKECPRRAKAEYNDDTVRASLARLEDTIIFALFERVKFPLNPPTYDLLGDLVRETEALQFEAHRYDNPEENPFFPENLPPFSAPEYPFTEFLQGAGASININKEIWEVYFRELLPKFVKCGDDGNYAQTAFADLTLLQAISKRIHYGKFFAEVRFKEARIICEPYIRAKDKEALMKFLTTESVENTVVMRRVEKKVMVFGRELSQEHDFKGDVSILYEKWLLPLTKKVQVEYLLKRLD
ncbi:chorismate mutase 2 isoform X1 [Vigna radiata var. radiata]|uniref:chorismate mutase n=1 Tax=Vigna radiata var. radiata TaxID=3916 RepID=A0A3Q0F1Y2_VIGRR|nr:chorismate mutase 2 isoform X1 [Vigna radiata var. radiata]XP_022636614.1 chorismate mutase 2 isoform X1 [Vigna radiata var. radiata]